MNKKTKTQNQILVTGFLVMEQASLPLLVTVLQALQATWSANVVNYKYIHISFRGYNYNIIHSFNIIIVGVRHLALGICRSVYVVYCAHSYIGRSSCQISRSRETHESLTILSLYLTPDEFWLGHAI